MDETRILNFLQKVISPSRKRKNRNAAPCPAETNKVDSRKVSTKSSIVHLQQNQVSLQDCNFINTSNYRLSCLYKYHNRTKKMLTILIKSRRLP